MTAATDSRPGLLLVGGSGGLVGRAVLPEFLPHYRIRSVHRHRAANEGPGVEWVRAGVNEIADWAALLDNVDVVLNLAWYRWESEASFRDLQDGLLRLVENAARANVRRFLQVSVPEAPARLEATLPYLLCKRRVDAAVALSGLSFRIVRPTILYGHGDRLLSVMFRLMQRYPFFPLFGDGSYHVSPVAVSDLARILRLEADGSVRGTVDLGGPERLSYRELTDRMHSFLGRPPRYWKLSASGARRLTRLLVAFGSTLLYPYEVEWLMSDQLGLPPYEGPGAPLQPVGPFLEQLAARSPIRESAGRTS